MRNSLPCDYEILLCRLAKESRKFLKRKEELPTAEQKSKEKSQSARFPPTVDFKRMRKCDPPTVDFAKKQRKSPAVAMIEWTAPLMAAGNWIPELVGGCRAVLRILN